MAETLLFGERNLTIVHIGGSHVQADAFSNRVRTMFSNMQPKAGAERGAFFIWSAAKTNGPGNMTTTSQGIWKKTQNSLGAADKAMGIMGYAITTIDSAAKLGFKLNAGDSDWKYSRLRMFAEIADSVTTPLLAVGGDTVRAEKEGNSYVFRVEKESDEGEIFFVHKTDSSGRVPEVTVRSLIAENDHYGISYHALGVNGASLASWLKCTEFDNEIGYLDPDLVIFGIGINDANVPASKFDTEYYKSQYRRLIKKFQRVNPKCVFVFITNNDCVLRLGKKSRGTNPNTPRVEQAMRELAKEYNGAVFNQYEIMGGMGSSAQWVKAGLMNSDRIHFTAAGYTVLGDLLFEALTDMR